MAEPPKLSDAGSVAQLVAAYELAYEGEAHTSAASLAGDWEGMNLTDHALLVRNAEGEIVALLDTVPNRAELLAAYAFVAPDSPAVEALNTYLAEVAEEKARQLSSGGPVTVRNYLPAGDGALAAVLSDRGYERVRTIYRMAAAVTDLATPTWPEGVTVRDYQGESDEPAVYEAFELGSVGMWGRPGNTLQQWRAITAGLRGEMRLALADGSIVGISITRVASDGDAGLVQSIRVVPAWRRRGLGAALLTDAFNACFRQGRRKVTLTVDAESDTGAPQLYTQAGMRATQRYSVFERRL